MTERDWSRYPGFPHVKLIDHMGNDKSIRQAARVSFDQHEDDEIAFFTGAGQAEQAIRHVEETKKKNFGLLNYLAKHRHGSPWEHVVFTWYVHAPIFVFREFHRHRIASYNERCLSGSTYVTRLTKNQGGTQHKKNATLEILWRNWHEGVPDTWGRNRLLASCKEIYVRSYDEQTLEPKKSKVVDIKKNGVKTTYLVTTEAGREIRSTLDHKYFTPDGWKRLEELQVGDYVYRSGMVRKTGEPAIPPRLRQGIGIWITQMKQFWIPQTGAHCYKCGVRLTYNEVQLDHVVPVVLDLKLALDPANIKPICKSCHRVKSNGEQKYADRIGSTASLRADRIVSIDTPLEEETYDLVLEDPYHNFLANGIVVHNSGRYSEMDPVFYVPTESRPLINAGTSAHPNYVPGTDEQNELVYSELIAAYETAWGSYQRMLDDGIAKEVARVVLPLGLYSAMYVTMNLRGLSNFLSLRTHDESATHVSHPQYEIEQVARLMEQDFARITPDAYRAWSENGRGAL